jgi:hypothetical protein
VNLVGNHVVQFLVVNYAYEDVHDKFFAAGTVVEDFAAGVAESEFNEVFADCVWAFVGEGCAVYWFAACSCAFAGE